MKITILGDMMCEPPILKASKTKDGYDFNGVFGKIKPMLDDADYVITNLEFPLAGEEAGYTDRFYAFNAPDSYAEAVKNAGVDLVSTVNNHTFDRGAKGMLRTIEVLDRVGLAHTGTFLPDKHEEAYYFELGGVKFAVVAYTYATNKGVKGEDPKYLDCVNYLRPYNLPTYLPEVSAKMKTWVDKRFPKMKEEHRAVIKMAVGLPNTIERADDYIDHEASKPYIERFREDIKKAKENADIVICYPHVGGQFNPQPGKFSEYVVSEAVKAGADAVMAGHSHMVQPIRFIDGVPCAYSLGNFSMSPNSTIIVKKNLPEYSLAMHLYVESGKIDRITFSILKAVEKRGKQMVVYPVDVLYDSLESKREKALLEKDVVQVYGYAMGRMPQGDIIQKEYTLL